jgi:hypothetical protein
MIRSDYRVKYEDTLIHGKGFGFRYDDRKHLEDAIFIVLKRYAVP